MKAASALMNLKPEARMDTKEKFAEYITAKRKAAGMTQREFADSLYVTNTAVSKWERGISYPDITLIKPICQALAITPQEFVDAGDDTAYRRAKVESGHYRRIALRYHLITLSVYAAAILAGLIVNLAVEARLSWALIVLPAALLAASLTNLPFAARHMPAVYRQKLIIASFTAPVLFLLLTLLATGVYAPPDWLPTASLGMMLGYTVLVLPSLLKKIPAVGYRHRVLICLTAPLMSLILLLLQISLWTGGSWFAYAFLGTLAGYAVFILPALLYRLDGFARKWNGLISAACTALAAGLLIAKVYIG
jgi:transcriptional regulator with XRE-family HTH domain